MVENLKKISLFFLVSGTLLLILASCSQDKVEVKRDTAMAAAKTFVKGMITGNTDYFKNLIYNGVSAPKPGNLIAVAKRRDMIGMKLNQFHFEKASEGHDAILVDFTDPEGDECHWKLDFVSEPDGFIFMGSNSAPIVNNNTPIQAAKVWFLGMTKNIPYLIVQLDPTSGSISGAARVIKNRRFDGLDYDDFKFEEMKFFRIRITFKNYKGKTESRVYSFPTLRDWHGYGHFFGYQVDDTLGAYTSERAAKLIITGMILGDPELLGQLSAPNIPENAPKQMVEVAKNHGIVNKMTVGDFNFKQGQDYKTIIVSFKDLQGKKVKWTLHFKEKGSQYYLSKSDILSQANQDKGKKTG